VLRTAYIYICDLAERNTATFFYFVAQMVEGEKVVKIFCFFPDILFPFDCTHFLPQQTAFLLFLWLILSHSVALFSTIRALFQGTKLNYAVFIVWLRTLSGSWRRAGV